MTKPEYTNIQLIGRLCLSKVLRIVLRSVKASDLLSHLHGQVPVFLFLAYRLIIPVDRKNEWLDIAYKCIKFISLMREVQKLAECYAAHLFLIRINLLNYGPLKKTPGFQAGPSVYRQRKSLDRMQWQQVFWTGARRAVKPHR